MVVAGACTCGVSFTIPVTPGCCEICLGLAGAVIVGSLGVTPPGAAPAGPSLGPAGRPTPMGGGPRNPPIQLSPGLSPPSSSSNSSFVVGPPSESGSGPTSGHCGGPPSADCSAPSTLPGAASPVLATGAPLHSFPRMHVNVPSRLLSKQSRLRGFI